MRQEHNSEHTCTAANISMTRPHNENKFNTLKSSTQYQSEQTSLLYTIIGDLQTSQGHYLLHRLHTKRINSYTIFRVLSLILRNYLGGGGVEQNNAM